MIPIADILALEAHAPIDSVEASHLARILIHASSPEAALLRSNLAGHLTASAWILNHDGSRALLLDHTKLKRLLQPGGHVDPEDESLIFAAKREAREETGLTDLISLSDLPFDVDSHTIPARCEEPEHIHYDVRFAFRLPSHISESDVAITAESGGYQWVEVAPLAESADQSLSRMARKSLDQFLIPSISPSHRP